MSKLLVAALGTLAVVACKQRAYNEGSDAQKIEGTWIATGTKVTCAQLKDMLRADHPDMSKDDIKCQERESDEVAAYALQGDRLFRFVRVYDNANSNQFKHRKCDVTTGVSDFKLSSNEGDEAGAYFKKDGDLYAVMALKDKHLENCPGAKKEVRLKDIKEFNVFNHKETSIVSLAVSKSGEFKAWTTTGEPFTVTNVKEYDLGCFKQEGKSFSSSVAFLMQYDGDVMKLKGSDPYSSKWDNKPMPGTSLKDWKEKNNVCK